MKKLLALIVVALVSVGLLNSVVYAQEVDLNLTAADSNGCVYTYGDLTWDPIFYGGPTPTPTIDIQMRVLPSGSWTTLQTIGINATNQYAIDFATLGVFWYQTVEFRLDLPGAAVSDIETVQHCTD